MPQQAPTPDPKETEDKSATSETLTRLDEILGSVEKSVAASEAGPPTSSELDAQMSKIEQRLSEIAGSSPSLIPDLPERVFAIKPDESLEEFLERGEAVRRTLRAEGDEYDKIVDDLAKRRRKPIDFEI